jgi:hypothetical protein
MLNRYLTLTMAVAAVLAAAELTNQEKEQFLRSAKIVSSQGLSMGVTNSRKALLESGTIQHAAHVQTIDDYKTRFESVKGVELNFRDSYKYNIAAYELAKLLELDMVPPSVERRASGSTAAVTWWVDDVAMTELDRHKKSIAPPDQKEWNRQMNTVHVFDQLIYNTDRNLGNLVITNDWRIWMIDHTRAFRIMPNCPNRKVLRTVDRGFLNKLRTLDEASLQARLGNYLGKREIKALLARRDEIVCFFDEQIATRGEEQVTFELARRVNSSCPGGRGCE